MKDDPAGRDPLAGELVQAVDQHVSEPVDTSALIVERQKRDGVDRDWKSQQLDPVGLSVAGWGV